MYDICRSVSVFNKSKDLSVVILTIPTISTKLCEIRKSQNTQFFTVSILNRALGTSTRIISIHESAMDKKEERREPEQPEEKEKDSVIPEFSIEYKRDV